jgi:phytoene/squalene synthetase
MSIMPESTSAYQHHLNRVSRSFAYCIARLDAPLRDQVGLSYLLCRILDTVEDSCWLEVGDQVQAFMSFESFLYSRPSGAEVRSWREGLPGGLREGERLLVDDAPRIIADFHDLDAKTRALVLDPILSMARGMRFFTARAEEGRLKLRSLAEVNQYCFFVAGVVGEVLTRLIERRDETGGAVGKTLRPDILFSAFHFGLFLQKVNLLKDQNEDEAEGRFLVPSKSEVAASLVENASHAMRYIEWIPDALRSFRFFCVSSFFLGLASLSVILDEGMQGAQNPALKKLARGETESLFGQIEAMLDDRLKLREFYEFLKHTANLERFSPRVLTKSDDLTVERLLGDFAELYSGHLSIGDIRSLLAAT